MRIRLKSCDLLDLARLYRNDAASDRRQAEVMTRTTQSQMFIDHAIAKTKRAEKLEALAQLGEEFVLVPLAPFNGGPPSLKVVGGKPRSPLRTSLQIKRRA